MIATLGVLPIVLHGRMDGSPQDGQGILVSLVSESHRTVVPGQVREEGIDGLVVVVDVLEDAIQALEHPDAGLVSLCHELIEGFHLIIYGHGV